MYKRCLLGCCIVAAFTCSLPVQGAAVILSGDLGPATWTGAFYSPMNTTITTPFLHATARGVISGDAIATNTGGTSFDLVVTNLSFTASDPLAGSTYVALSVLQNFAPLLPAGTYSASHSLGGSWSTGASNFISGDAIHDFGGSDVQLPTLSFHNTFMAPTFGVPAAGANVTNTIAVYSIKLDLQMFVESDGFISLPNSYHTSATLVPEPASACLLLLGGCVVMPRRHRRRLWSLPEKEG